MGVQTQVEFINGTTVTGEAEITGDGAYDSMEGTFVCTISYINSLPTIRGTEKTTSGSVKSVRIGEKNFNVKMDAAVTGKLAQYVNEVVANSGNAHAKKTRQVQSLEGITISGISGEDWIYLNEQIDQI